MDKPLLEAAERVVDIYQRQREKEQWRTKTLREAANAARNGDKLWANKLKREVDDSYTVVFNYEDALKELERAVKRVRKLRRS
jgi:hypothetical protein